MKTIFLLLFSFCANSFLYAQAGMIDTGFRHRILFDSRVKVIRVQEDQKILIGGDFREGGPLGPNYFGRVNPDGTRDENFIIGMGFDSPVNDIQIQNDGKILVSGSFSRYNNIQKKHLIRLNKDGTPDSNFNVPLTLLGSVTGVVSVAMQNDGKIIIVSLRSVHRINSDGSLDSSFKPLSLLSFEDGILNKAALQKDGKILIGGSFKKIGGNNIGHLVRLNSDGNIDTEFQMEAGFDGAVEDIKVQEDNKIVVGGQFAQYNNFKSNRLIRLNENGTVDQSFSIGNGFNSIVFCVEVQENGRILVGGWFTEFDGMKANRFVKLNSDGKRDTTFDTGDGFNSIVFSAAVQADQKILVGGIFSAYNGFSYGSFIRILGNANISSIHDNEPENEILVYPNPLTRFDELHMRYPKEISKFDLIDLKGRIIYEQLSPSNFVLDLKQFSDISPGIYFLRFILGKQISTHKVVIIQ